MLSNSFRRAPVALMLLATVLAGCASAPPQQPFNPQSVLNPERSSRGNPVFYEVAGERYYVLNSSDGFAEQGIASWYGRDFHGRPTSSGEIYDMYQLTAAHKTLPIPTWVEVTNLGNGRRVIVKVNDRGPFVNGRVIDLSQRAASDLGMIDAGTAPVHVRALGSPSLVAAAPPVTTTEESSRGSGGGFSIISEARADSVGADDAPYRPIYVQVGAFSDRNNAERLAERLKDDGFADSFVLTFGSGRERLHRVRIGPIQIGEYDQLQADLRAAGVDGARLVQDN